MHGDLSANIFSSVGLFSTAGTLYPSVGGPALAELVDHEAGAQLGLKPGGLRGHDVAGVGNVDDLLHAHGIEGEGDLHLAVVDATLQLAEATDTADEVDALVGAEVLDAEYLVENEVREDGDIEHADGIVVVEGAGLGGHLVPVAVEVHAELVQLGGLVDVGAHILNVVAFADNGNSVRLVQKP